MAEATSPTEEGRRARLRRETMRALKTAALDEVREHGAAALSLRRVARRMRMSAPGLYRYVDSREHLLTTLIADGYDALADHLALGLGAAPRERVVADRPPLEPPVIAPTGADVADRLRAVTLAYRDWAVRHPNEFMLLFGDPVPGYAAPPDGPTTEAMRRVGLALAAPLVEAWRLGRLEVRPALEDPRLEEPLGPLAGLAEEELPAGVAALLLLAWGRVHGQVSLEVFGHHDWLFPDGCEPLFRADVEAMVEDLGLTRR